MPKTRNQGPVSHRHLVLIRGDHRWWFYPSRVSEKRVRSRLLRYRTDRRQRPYDGVTQPSPSTRGEKNIQVRRVGVKVPLTSVAFFTLLVEEVHVCTAGSPPLGDEVEVVTYPVPCYYWEGGVDKHRQSWRDKSLTTVQAQRKQGSTRNTST